MITKRSTLAGLAVIAASAATAAADFQIRWYTIDGGGGAAAGGPFEVVGTIGQYDAGPTMAGGRFALTGGFWPGIGSACPADFDGDGNLSVSDFSAFRQAFLAGDLRADFNGDGTLSIADFTAFRSAFLAGCG